MSRQEKIIQDYQGRLKVKGVDNITVFIQSVIDADITKGKYVRFLLNCFLDDRFSEEDLSGGLDSTIGRTVGLFHRYKEKLNDGKRSVYQYESPGDLWNAVKEFEAVRTGRLLKREEKELAYQQTEFLYEDQATGFRIVCPLTEYAAQWWGRGTRWCTASDTNNMFERYAYVAPLFVIIMPNGDKLQLWRDGSNVQFMTDSDDEVSVRYIESNWSILEPICLWLKCLQFIPRDMRCNDEILKSFLRHNGLNLRQIRIRERTKELCYIAVESNGLAIRFVPYELIEQDLCNLAVYNHADALEHIPEEYQTYDICLEAIKQNCFLLDYTPTSLIDKRMCELAVLHGYPASSIPEHLRTEKMNMVSDKNHKQPVRQIPEDVYRIAFKEIRDCFCELKSVSGLDF